MPEINRANGYRLTGLLQPTTPEISPEAQPRPEDLAFDLEAALAAVFGLRAEVPEDAFTAQTLGTQRQGNGVLISEDGLVLTIGYLVTEAESIALKVSSTRTVPATVIGFDYESGFGLVRALETIDVAPLARGSAATLHEGDSAIVAAYGGVVQALTARVVSKREFAGYWEYLLDEAIFTVPPHPAWSGGALIGGDGRLLGIGSLLVQDALPGEKAVAGNMMVPIDLLEPILSDIVETGRIRKPPRPWLGMFATDAPDHLVVAGLVRGGPAHTANLRVGDTILSVGGEEVTTLPDLFRRIWGTGNAGVEVKLGISRDQRRMQVSVRSGNRFEYLKPPRRH